MKKLIVVSLAIIISQVSFAQEKKQFEVKNFDGMVTILGSSESLHIQGYDGKSVVIEADQIGENKIPEKAKGLKMVTAGGIDNTGMSATVKETKASLVTKLDKEGKPVLEEVKVLEITLSNNQNLFKNYVIKIPRKVNVVFKQANNLMGDTENVISFSGLSSELDVSCYSCSIDVSDFSGNIIANNNFGNGIKVEFSELSQERLSSIRSEQGDIEVILPSTTKANLKLNAIQGNIYTDFDLEKAVLKDAKTAGLNTITVYGKPLTGGLENPNEAASFQEKLAKTQEENQFNIVKVVTGYPTKASINRLYDINSERYDYTINGGGVFMSINASFGGNIYLRKK